MTNNLNAVKICYGHILQKGLLIESKKHEWSMQILREKNFKQTIPAVRVEDGEEVTYEKTTTTLRRSANFLSALQASDGHWPAENSGVLFFLPPFVSIFFLYHYANSYFNRVILYMVGLWQLRNNYPGQIIL